VSFPRSPVRGWFRTFVIALVVALGVTVGGLVGVNWVYDQKVGSIERVDVDLSANTDPAEPANFLLIGSDSRAFVETAEQEEAFGDPEVESGQRSDTIMVVHVDPEARTGLLVSFPRDLVVDIPGEGEQKINAAYNLGPQKVVDTIQENFDIDIHHYLEVDFSSFEGIVSAVGGVPIYFPAPARDQKTGLNISFIGAPFPACYELDGPTALAYVRSRAYEQEIDGEWVSDEKYDFGRIERQQAFMRRLASEAVATALSNPLKANRIADEALSELKADEGLSRTDINKLIQAFRRVDPNDPNSIEMVTVPTDRNPSYAGLGDVQVLNDELAAPLLERLRTFETAPTLPEDGPSPSSIRVRVLNASGVTGLAADTESVLREHGFQSGGIGDADSLDETEIRYRSNSKDKAEAVRGLLDGDVGELVEDDTIVEADVQIMLGADFEGITPPSTTPAESTAAPETTAAPESTGEPATEPEDAPEDPGAVTC
jgi:LCP family protein required for cell wall assembly